MQTRIIVFLIIYVFLTITPPVFAKDIKDPMTNDILTSPPKMEDYKLEQEFKWLEEESIILFTPSRLNIQKHMTSATISVISRNQLERQKAFFVEEALRNLPGLYVQRSGSYGEQTFVRIRGADVDQILVLMDGVQVNSPWNGFFDFADLTIDNVERIEVLKGNQSALYGSDSLGGVINIISRKGKEGLKSSIKTGGGNQATFREEFRNERGWDKFNYSVAASRTDSSGQYARDRYDNSSITGQAELKISNDMSINYRGYYNEASKEIGIGIFAVSSMLLQTFFDENWKNKKQLFINNLNLNHNPNEWWNYSIQGSYVKDELIVDDKASPEQDFDVFYTLKTNRITIGTQHNFLPWKSDVISLGLEYKEEGVDRNRESPSIQKIDQSKKDWGLYIQNIFSYKDTFSLTAGFRADRHESFGNTYNPKVSAFYMFLPTKTKIKTSWGTGFKAPSIQELYTPVLGNPDLKPEETESYEVGIEQRLFDYPARMELVFFHIDFKDLIERSQTGVDNVGKAKTEGIEFSLHYTPLPNLDLSGNYTYQKAENKDTGEPLRRPENIWNFNAFYQYKEKLNVNLDINIVGDKFEDTDFIITDGTRLEGPVEGYEKIDVALSYLVKQWLHTNELKFFAKINNLLDQKYYETKGFRAPGINFFAGLNLSF